MGVARLGQGWVARKLEAGLPLVVVAACGASVDRGDGRVRVRRGASGGHQNFECSSQFQRFRRLESIIAVLDER